MKFAVVAICGVYLFLGFEVASAQDPDVDFDGNGQVEFVDFLIFAPGVIGAGEEIALDSTGDGLTLDTEGNLYVTQTQQNAYE